MPNYVVEHLPVGLLQCNCVIIGDPETGRALVVDPGDDVDKIGEVLERHGLTVAAIAATHAHIDHVGGLAKLKQLTGAPALMHQADMPLYERMDEQAQFLGVPAPEVTTIDRYLEDAAKIEFGKGAAQVSHTPGHTPGSVVLTLESRSRAGAGHEQPVVLSGDTLFAGSIGRTDLWGGSFEDIMKSLRGTLLSFADDTVVIPGHGPQTTIGVERRTNPFLG